MRKYFVLSFIIIVGIFASGCSGGGYAGVDGEDSSALLLNVNWPGGSCEDGVKIIPADTVQITVTMTGAGLTEPLVSSVSFPERSLLIEEIPPGNKTADIVAKDSGGTILALRKESFKILPSTTHEAGNMPLGAAITGNTSNPLITPANIDVYYGDNLNIQNWLENPYTFTFSAAGMENMAVQGAWQDVYDRWTFDEISVIPELSGNCSLVENPGASMSVNVLGQDYRFDLKWGSSSIFNTIRGVAVDSEGNVYITDVGSNYIRKFTSTGTPITGWGGTGYGNSQFDGPWGISIDKNDVVYIGSFDSNNIQKFTSDGTFLRRYAPGFGSGDGKFNHCYGLDVDDNGDIYVSDRENDRVQVFNSNFEFQRKWGGYGSGNTQFNAAIDLHIDHKNGLVYVADTANKRVQKFSTDGAYIREWGTGGSGPGKFAWPVCIQLDASGMVFVGDHQAHNIQKFKPDGTYLKTIGGSGSGDARFNGIGNITLDDFRNVLYVTDPGNYRVQKFVPTE